MYVYCIPQFTMYDILCTHQASPCRQGDVYSMTIAHHWNSGEQTIPMRYGTAIEELIRRSSALETPPNLAHATSDRSSTCSGRNSSSVFGNCGRTERHHRAPVGRLARSVNPADAWGL